MRGWWGSEPQNHGGQRAPMDERGHSTDAEPQLGVHFLGPEGSRGELPVVLTVG
jgi:hypothetical protein